jgi:hypothetical protein
MLVAGRYALAMTNQIITSTQICPQNYIWCVW